MELTSDLDKKDVILKALQNSTSSEEYEELIRDFAENGKTTGPNQSDDLVHYTKLNAQRSKRVGKTARIDEKLSYKLSSINQKQTWLLITESWCGDAANSVPVLSKLSALNDQIDLRIVLRDENLDLMDRFLTNGGRSIPKLIALDENSNVLYTWGPRPQEAQELYDEWRFSENKVPYKEFQIELQKWYNKDGGASLQMELLDLIS